jgi:hypothetical protein
LKALPEVTAPNSPPLRRRANLACGLALRPQHSRRRHGQRQRVGTGRLARYLGGLLRIRQARLQRLDAVLVLAAHGVELGTQRVDVGIAGGERGDRGQQGA